MAEYEYAIIRHGDAPDDLHREPRSLEACLQWIEECEQMGMHKMFLVVRRPIGEWEVM